MVTVRKTLLLPLVAILLGGCTKEKVVPTTSFPRSKVDARVNSGLFYSVDAQAQLSGESLTIVGSRTAANGKATSIVLRLKHYKGPNTYIIDTATEATYTDFGVVYTADTGRVVISDINSVKYAGSFEFRARGNGGTISVSDGVIDIYK